MPLPVIPWLGLSLGLAVGSSQFLAEDCWFLWGWVGWFPVLYVFVVRVVLVPSCVLCVSGACVGGGSGNGGGVCCVCAGACVVCRQCVWLPAPAFPGLGLRLCVDSGVVCSGPSPVLPEGPGCGSPSLLAGVRCCWCLPLPPCLPPPLLPLLRFLACCSPCACSGTTRAMVGVRWGWVGGGRLDAGSGPIPLLFSLWGGGCLHPPSSCNAVLRAVHLYSLRTNGPVS